MLKILNKTKYTIFDKFEEKKSLSPFYFLSFPKEVKIVHSLYSVSFHEVLKDHKSAFPATKTRARKLLSCILCVIKFSPAGFPLPPKVMHHKCSKHCPNICSKRIGAP